MRSIAVLSGCIAALAALCQADSNLTKPQTSNQILPGTFTPPQVFQHTNLARTIVLAKGYPKETINVVVENVDKSPHSEYYVPFKQGHLARIGGFEVRDKNSPELSFSDVEIVEIDQER